jgi:subtilisin family serine protease
MINITLGINGIATNVQIMVLRTTPKGDERDKDVALAIMYAVDNKADIINMSFGKQISPQKEFVDIAVKYAEEHNVLIIHGAGNYGFSLDMNESFPSDRYIDRTEAKNWLNVGASDMILDKNLPAKFSNYGVNNVDIFAPGVNIISLDTSNTYSMHNGTSESAPIATGIAALILSYYPNLTPAELIKLLLESSSKITKPKKVLQPDLSGLKREKVKFNELSKSGGVINAYNAFLLAKEQFE